MKDKYGYITICQKNYSTKYQKNTQMKMRRVEPEGMEPQVQIDIEIRTLKGNGKTEKLYTEYGSIILEGEVLAEVAKLFEPGLMESRLTPEARVEVHEVLETSETPLDSIQVKRLVEAKGYPTRDWREYSYYLEDLTGRGIAKHAGIGSDGHQKYRTAEF